MDVTGDLLGTQSLEEFGGQVEVRLVNELRVGFEGVRPIRHAVEDRPGTHVVQECIQIRVDQQIHHDDILFRQIFETPRRHQHRGTEHVLSKPQDRSEQVCTDESTGTQDQNGSLQALDSLREIRHDRSKDATRLSGSKPHSRRWNCCEPYRPDT